MSNYEARAKVRCPRCHETFIDTDMREWMDAGHSPEEFHDAMMRLVNAHADTCKPHPPEYTAKMRHGRLRWRLGTWFPATWFVLVAAAYLTGLLGHNALAYGGTLLCAGICLILNALRERTTYSNGYVRGFFAGEHHQPYLIARWLHPGDGVNDPADNEPDRQPEETS